MMKKPLKILLIVAASVAGAAMLAGAAAFYRWYVDNRMPAFGSSAIIRIRPETTADELLAQVDSLLSPYRPGSIRRTFAKESVEHHMCPGSYIVDSTFTARYFARVVTRGWENPVELVLAGRLRSPGAIAGKIASQMMVDSTSLVDAFRDSALLAKFGMDTTQLFEMILPDTYQMYWTATPQVIIERLKAEHDMFWNKERVEAAGILGLTPHEVTVLASIVSEESSKPDEYPKIASVYLNRLRKGMRLQACPTICYMNGYRINRVLMSHIMVDSPYNTYLHDGLPPTPICVPGKDHIDAVLHPAETRYLYFCADSSFNGRNVFASSFAEHQKNAALYQQALDELMARKAAEAAAAMEVEADSLQLSATPEEVLTDET